MSDLEGLSDHVNIYITLLRFNRLVRDCWESGFVSTDAMNYTCVLLFTLRIAYKLVVMIVLTLQKVIDTTFTTHLWRPGPAGSLNSSHNLHPNVPAIACKYTMF